MQARHHVDVFALEQRDKAPAAKATIDPGHFPGLDPSNQLPGEHRLMRVEGVQGEAYQPACRQTEHAHKSGGWKTAAALLIGSIGPSLPVFRRVRHRQAGPVDHLHRSAAPFFSVVALEPSAEFLVRRLQRADRQARTRLAVGAAVLVGDRLMARRRPGLHPAHRLAAGTASAEHLAEKGDEGHSRGEHPAPASFGRLEQIRRDESTDQRRQAVERIGFLRQPLCFRTAAVQQMRKPGKI